MLSKNQIRILNYFRKNLFDEKSILQLSKTINKKSYQRVYEAVESLAKNNMLKLKKIGNTTSVSLELSHETIIQLSYLSEEETIKKDIPHKGRILSIKEITDYLIIITGSHAKGQANTHSDLDLVIVLPDGIKAMQVQKLIDNITITDHPPIHTYVFNKKDMLEMLLEKKGNYGKEILINHLILKNARIFYEIIREARENGYKGE